jgi:hypothetical protein
MKRLLTLFFFHSLLYAQEYSSFIHSTNQYTNQLLFYRPYTQTAILKEDSFYNVDLSESNIFQKSDTIEADFEITTLEFAYWYRYSDRVELSFDYPIYYLSSGFLDDFLDSVHHSLGITTTRENDGHINNQIHFISGNINKTKSYVASGNPQIELKYLLYNKNKIALSSIFGIKIPLGDTDDGFSSGGVDFMGALALQKSYEKVMFLFNFAVTYNAKHRVSTEIVSKKNRYFSTLATEFNLYKSIDFLASYLYESAPYSGGGEKYDSASNFLQFALREKLKNGEYIDIYFNQNTIPRHNEADVTFGLSYFFKGI